MKISPAITRTITDLFCKHGIDRALALQSAERVAIFLGAFQRIQIQMVFADSPVPPQAQAAAEHSSFEACIYCALELISESAKREEIMRISLSTAHFAAQWVMVGLMVQELHVYLRQCGFIILR